MFLRDHLVGKAKEMDAFMKQTEKTRLYVSGPPGCGKTTFFYGYFMQWARKKKESGLIVQYRVAGNPKVSLCDIILLNGDNSPRRVVHPGLTTAGLADLVHDVIDREPPFSFCVFDGVRQTDDVCWIVLATINGRMGEQKAKAIHIAPLEFHIKGSEGTSGTWGIDKHLSVNSWKQGDYEQCVAAGLLGSKEWVRLLQTEEDKDEEFYLENVDDEGTESVPLAPTDAEEESKTILAMIERKFYYAGGCAGFFFVYSMEELFAVLKLHAARVSYRDDWASFATLKSHFNIKSHGSVLAMMQCIDGNAFPVSKYMMNLAYTHCKDDLVKSMKAVAIASCNPTIIGWAFELEQLHIVTDQTQAGGSVSNKDRSLFLPVAKGATVVYDGRKLFGSGEYDLKKNSDMPFVVTCAKWNQGCFNLAFVAGEKLITVNFTISASHSLNVSFIRELKQSLENANRPIKEITHIAVVNDSNTLEEFKFDKAEGCGYMRSRQLYTIKIARAMEFVRPATALLEENACTVEAQLGEHLEDVGVYVIRTSGRKKQKIDRSDPSG